MVGCIIIGELSVSTVFQATGLKNPYTLYMAENKWVTGVFFPFFREVISPLWFFQSDKYELVVEVSPSNKIMNVTKFFEILPQICEHFLYLLKPP